MTLKIIIMILCLILSALFSGSEIVYSKVNRMKLERDVNNHKKHSTEVLKVHDNFSKTITTILIGNNLVNILLSSVAALVAISLFGDTDLVSTLTTIVVTVIVLIFGEILPKTIFQSYSYSLSYFLLGFMNFFNILFFPLTFVFGKISNLISKLFKNYPSESNEDLEDTFDEELINMTDDLEEKGKIDSDDAELIKSAIDATDTSAWEIMVPRVDVVGYDIDDGFETIVQDKDFFINSRVLLYHETIDNVVGIIDTTKVLKNQLNHLETNLEDVLYEPLYVHKTMPIASVLKELKASHKHLAIVLDEWGGTYGILTIEDILEELFGEIWDETDTVENDYEKISDDTFLIDGDMALDDFFDLIEFEQADDFETDYSTIGGLCIQMLDKLPDVGDEFDFENCHITIVAASEKRVEKVKVQITPKFIEEE